MSTSPTKSTVDISRDLIDHISRAVSDSPDAASAREALAARLKDQGAGGIPESATTAPEPVDETAHTVPFSVITRPNGVDYTVRKIGPHDDVAMIRMARDRKINILAYGPPGTGKTALIEVAFAGKAKDDPFTPTRVYTVQGSGDTETADFIGGHIQLPGGEFEWVDGPLVRAMEEGAVLYIDEISLIDPKVLSIVYGVMDGRDELLITQNPERGVVTAQPGFYVVAACNPNAPGSRMSEALTSRFALQVQITTDYKLAKKLGVSKTFITAAQNLERKREGGEVGWSPQMRECLAFKELSDAFGEDVALRNAISIAPEIDRPVVADVLSRAFAKPLTELAVS